MLFGIKLTSNSFPCDLENYYVLYTKDKLSTLLDSHCMFLYTKESLQYLSFDIFSLFIPDLKSTDTRDLFKEINIASNAYKKLNPLRVGEYNIYRDSAVLVVLSDDFVFLGSIDYTYLGELYSTFFKYSRGELQLKKLGEYT